MTDRYTNNPLRNAGSLTTHNPTIAQGVSGIVLGAANLFGVGVLVGNGVMMVVGQAVLSGVGLLSGIGSLVVRGVANLSGTGFLSAVGSLIQSGVATLSGVGSLVANGVLMIAGSAIMSGSGTISAIGVLIHRSVVALSGTGTLVGNAVLTIAGQATLIGIGLVSAAGSVIGGITHLISSTLLGVGRFSLSLTNWVAGGEDVQPRRTTYTDSTGKRSEAAKEFITELKEKIIETGVVKNTHKPYNPNTNPRFEVSDRQAARIAYSIAKKEGHQVGKYRGPNKK